MSSSVPQRLIELGIELPLPAAPAAAYVPFAQHGDLLFMAGQIPVENGERKFIGKVGAEFSIEQGQQAARLCSINLLAQLQIALNGDWERFARVVRLGGFVNCAADFDQQAQVINGASQLMIEVFGETGKHARTAVGTNVLPFNVAVEVEAIFAIKA